MLLKNKSLVAVMSCALMLAAAPLLPADLSIINSAAAKEGGGGHGGGGGGGGNGGGGREGSDHAGNTSSNGRGKGLASDHAGKATRSHGISGNHFGSERNDDNGHGIATSGVAHSKDTRGIDKARAISDTTPGDHNTKGLSKVGSHKSH